MKNRLLLLIGCLGLSSAVVSMNPMQEEPLRETLGFKSVFITKIENLANSKAYVFTVVDITKRTPIGELSKVKEFVGLASQNASPILEGVQVESNSTAELNMLLRSRNYHVPVVLKVISGNRRSQIYESDLRAIGGQIAIKINADGSVEFNRS